MVSTTEALRIVEYIDKDLEERVALGYPGVGKVWAQLDVKQRAGVKYEWMTAIIQMVKG